MKGMASTLGATIVDTFVEAGYAIAYVGEKCTSKACSRPGCSGECERFKRTPEGKLSWSLVQCTQCGVIYQRDFNSARNIRLVGVALQRGEQRPAHQ